MFNTDDVNGLNIVILCGGNGSRLWPLSRKKMPKQFLKLTDDNMTLLQTTALRAKKLNPSSITVIVNKLYTFIVKQQLDDVNIANYKIISEPASRNTGPAIAVASNLFNINDNILILTSDHAWEDNKFVNMVREGKELLTDDNIVFFGIRPSYPETGYGYLKVNNNDLCCFVEKPNIDKANEFLNSGTYMWNSGIFLFKNISIQRKFEQFNPTIFEGAKTLLCNINRTDDLIVLDENIFNNLDNVSIDYAIMEHCTNGKVIIYDGFWSDIGSFNALYNYNNDKTSDNTVSIDTKNCLIKSDGSNRLITTIGIENMVIVDTPDALLICNKDRCQEVKNLVKELDGRVELTEHKTEYRPWGYYTSISGDDYSGYKVKKIVVYPGKKLSLQIHSQRSEHWVFITGEAKVRVGDDYHIFRKNQSVYIPIGVKHRVENVGTDNVEFIETQIGSYLGEDDIIRYEDDWNRT